MKKPLFFLLGILVLSSVSFKSVAQKQPIKWKYVSNGSNTAYALDDEDNLWSWGNNASGQIGDTYEDKVLYPEKISDDKWETICGSGGWVLGLKKDGTIWAWGANGTGQHGNGTNEGSRIPTQIGSDNDWKYICAGSGDNTFALKEDGTLWLCGKNVYGELGLGENSDMLVFNLTKHGTDKWKMISGGMMHTVGIKEDGTMWACGHNNGVTYGKLGIGDDDLIDSPIFLQIGTSNDWATVSTGGYHALALREDGSLFVWGDNGWGQLGNGTYTYANAPIQIGEDTDWVKVAAAVEHSMAIKADGTLWVWGAEPELMLGLPDINEGKEEEDKTHWILEPTKLNDDTDWVDVSTSFSFTMALKENGNIWSWGKNDYAQLGNNTLEDNGRPTLLIAEKDAVSIETETKNAYVKVYPNPVKDIINIKTSDLKINNIRLFNIQGTLLNEIAANPAGHTSMNVSQIPTGIYMLIVDTENGPENYKIIKK